MNIHLNVFAFVCEHNGFSAAEFPWSGSSVKGATGNGLALGTSYVFTTNVWLYGIIPSGCAGRTFELHSVVYNPDNNFFSHAIISSYVKVQDTFK